MTSIMAVIWRLCWQGHGASIRSTGAQGYIYNIYSAAELLSEASNAGHENDLTLFEIGCGGNGIDAVGPDGVHYARTSEVDLFVTPRVARHLPPAGSARNY